MEKSELIHENVLEIRIENDYSSVKMINKDIWSRKLATMRYIAQINEKGTHKILPLIHMYPFY